MSALCMATKRHHFRRLRFHDFGLNFPLESEILDKIRKFNVSCSHHHYHIPFQSLNNAFLYLNCSFYRNSRQAYVRYKNRVLHRTTEKLP